MSLDVIYLVRRGDHNPELAYSLRSLVNIPHRNVWIVGHKPKWVTNVAHMPTRQAGTKYQNTTAAVRAACANDELTDSVLLFNDDFFIMQPIDSMPTLHLGPVEERIAYHRAKGSRGYATGAMHTADLLRRWGHPRVLSYEVHAPMVIHRATMAHLLDRAATERLPILHKRTLYGTSTHAGGACIEDPKVYDDSIRTWDDYAFLSTVDETFRRCPVGAHIRAKFPVASPHELTVP